MGSGRPDKREDVLAAARATFAGAGYANTGIDRIAARAGVSTRTIYNHFPGGKEELFATAIAESAGRVADALATTITRHLEEVDDLEEALRGLAHDWLLPRDEFAEHFAMVRRMRIEAETTPERIREAWHAAGPTRAVGELAARFEQLATAGVLEVTDPQLAASHFLALSIGEVLHADDGSVDQERTSELIAAGVHRFLHGYVRRDRAPGSTRDGG